MHSTQAGGQGPRVGTLTHMPQAAARARHTDGETEARLTQPGETSLGGPTAGRQTQGSRQSWQLASLPSANPKAQVPQPRSACPRGESNPRTLQEAGDGDNGDPQLTPATQEDLQLPDQPVGSIIPHAGTQRLPPQTIPPLLSVAAKLDPGSIQAKGSPGSNPVSVVPSQRGDPSPA